MIAKIIAYGRDRDEALARLRRALADTTVIIEGGATNKSFLLDLLDQPEVIDGSADTGWIDRVRGEGRLVSHRHSGVALVAAAIEAYEEQEQVERQRLLATAHGGRPQVQHEVGRRRSTSSCAASSYRVTVAQIGPHRFRVGIGPAATEHVVDAELERLDDVHEPAAGRRPGVPAGRRRPTVPVHLVEVDGVTHRVSRDEGGVLRSPAPALVVATPVAVGAEVEAGRARAGAGEHEDGDGARRRRSRRGVRELLVATGGQVETGAPLVRLEPLADDESAATAAGAAGGVRAGSAERRRGPSAAERAEPRCCADLRGMLLGFDVDPRDERPRPWPSTCRLRAELGR